MKDFMWHVKEFEFSPENDEEPLKGLVRVMI